MKLYEYDTLIKYQRRGDLLCHEYRGFQSGLNYPAQYVFISRRVLRGIEWPTRETHNEWRRMRETITTTIPAGI